VVLLLMRAEGAPFRGRAEGVSFSPNHAATATSRANLHPSYRNQRDANQAASETGVTARICWAQPGNQRHQQNRENAHLSHAPSRRMTDQRKITISS
jgi:hypothetical protein